MVHVILDHHPIIHLVNMVASQNQGHLGSGTFDGIKVLIDGVGGASIPILAINLLGWDDVDKFIELAAKEPPALINMTRQGKGFVLGEYQNASES
jgi:hypothetical protein